MFDFEAHRGGRDARPENTLYSYLYALEIGAATIECDMQLARDGIVMSHNPWLNPDITTDSEGHPVEEGQYDLRTMTIKEIRQFNVGHLRPGTKYAREHGTQVPHDARIPTLEELFSLIEAAGNRTIGFNIETKSYPNPESPYYRNNADPERFVHEFYRIVKKHHMERRVILQSFDWTTLILMKRLDPSIRTSALYQQQPSWGVDGDTLWLGRKEPSPWLGGIRLSDCGGSVIEAAHKAGAHILSPYYREIGAIDVKHAHSLAMKVVSWTINEKEDMERELDKGVDGMISDRPALLRQVLTARGIPLPDKQPCPNSPYHLEEL